VSSEEAVPARVLCPFCEAEISPTAKKCRYCGEWVARNCEVCGTPLRNEWAARGICVECNAARQTALAIPTARALTPPKSRTAAALFALLLGGIGAHKFYLGKPGMGILYILFCWTLLPALVSLFEGIGYLLTSDEEFAARHP
jgi:ribosomal protein L40E